MKWQSFLLPVFASFFTLEVQGTLVDLDGLINLDPSLLPDYFKLLTLCQVKGADTVHFFLEKPSLPEMLTTS